MLPMEYSNKPTFVAISKIITRTKGIVCYFEQEKCLNGLHLDIDEDARSKNSCLIKLEKHLINL